MYLTHVTSEGERWDAIAYAYYGDPYGYERIIATNPTVPIGAALAGGIVLAIPIIDPPQQTQDLPPWLK